jgi:hypothetical protein
MNPHAFTRLAGRVLLVLAAMTITAFLASCGSSSSSTAINPVGFSNSSLSGTYVFSSQGADAANGYPLAVAGTLVANGTGGITGGTIDVVDPAFDISPSVPPSPAAQTIASGSYAVGSDGRGQASLTTTAYGTYILDFVLISGSRGLVSEFDGNGTGSGTIDLQTAVTGVSQLAGPYAFSLGGSDSISSLAPLATVGAFTLNSSGASTAGIEDFNDAGVVGNESLTGTITTLGTGTGPGQITLVTSSLPLTFDFYPIDASHWKLIETDYSKFIAGDVFTQTGSSIPTGAMAFTMQGGITAPIAVAGFITDNGTTVSGSEDVNDAGTVVTQTTFSGMAGAAGSVGGRVVASLSGFNPATSVVLYPSGGGTLMLEIDGSNLTVGAGQTQQAGAALAASQALGFNLSAVNISGGAGALYEEDDIAQFTTTSSGFTGAIDINDEGTLSPGQALVGSYTLASPATNGGSVTTTAAGSQFVSFNFYPVSSGQFLVLETDGNQIGAGTFEAQSPTAQVAQSSHMSMMPLVVRPRAAFRRRK